MSSASAKNDELFQSKALRGEMASPPSFETKEEEREWVKFRLAQAFRIFGNHGYTEGPAGHITVRDPILPDNFWVNPMGLHFKLIQPDDLLLVDHAGTVNEQLSLGRRNRILNRAAFVIHSKIHTARPDVLCAAHTHSMYGKAFSALGKPLDMLTQDSTAFYEDHVLYDQFNGMVVEDDEGDAIAAAMGTKKAAILQNHGLLVATSSIEATVHFYMALERCCQAQLLADAAAQHDASGPMTKKIRVEEARETGRVMGAQRAGWFAGSMEFELLEHQEGVRYKFKN
ncbi:Aldolase-II domain-containing protein [Mycena chlorophos]|uniref:Aldolase-II domain-containing protein n=1 Tax=Mycena chlorophos TaxID=658473 RepID=A0A8H6SUW9_MYCCL|nr:Aldolase-II domain-containing protein [Mycena chlorophos]